MYSRITWPTACCLALVLNGSARAQELEPVASRKFEGAEAGDGRELVPGIAFHWCPAGTFMMGSPKTERGQLNKHEDNENQVEVTLSAGFWMGETELTQGQWETVMGTSLWKEDRETLKVGANYAASDVSHVDAVSFCEKLTSQERSAGRLAAGWKYALPTEAQWEYACRTGTKTSYSFGNTARKLGNYAWYSKNADQINEYYPHEVGKKSANAWGLKDMHGNVREWVSDWYDEKLAGGLDPQGPKFGTERVIRDGSWFDIAPACRCANRRMLEPDMRFGLNGFRVAGVPSHKP